MFTLSAVPTYPLDQKHRTIKVMGSLHVLP